MKGTNAKTIKATTNPKNNSTNGLIFTGTTVQGTPVMGDSGYSAPGGHALNDCPEEEGHFAMGGAEDLTYCDEPERASGMRGADDAPSTAPSARGEIAHSEELKASQRPVQRGPVRMDELTESTERTASARIPLQEAVQPTVATENAATSVQTAESRNTELS
jgi:hypothetical protein